VDSCSFVVWGDHDCELFLSWEAMAAYSGVTTRHLAPLVHLLGIAGVVLMAVWTYSFRGGYGLSGAGVFNLHPLIMFAGFIFLSSEAIVVYKIGSGDRAWQKAVHMSVQGVAIVLAVVGVCAAYKFHIDSGIQNFYSLHSWFGVTTIALYVVQWGWGFVAFWQQRVAKAKRAELLPWHVFVGLAAYAAALVTAELGLLEKLTFLQKSGASPLGLWSSEAMLVNFVGIAIFAYGAVVVLTTLVPKSRKEAGYRDMLE
jgi:cytochrome b-561